MLGKAKSLFNKADDMLDGSVAKVKKSKAFGSVSSAFKKAEGFVEDKIDDLEKSDLKKKLGSLADKVEDKFDEFTRNVKDKTKGSK